MIKKTLSLLKKAIKTPFLAIYDTACLAYGLYTRNSQVRFYQSLSNNFLIDSIKRGNLRQFNLALKLGATPNDATEYTVYSQGYTTKGALFLAAGQGHKEMVRRLAQVSLDINKKDGGYYYKTTTPLEHAFSKGHKEIAHMLYSEFGATLPQHHFCANYLRPIKKTENGQLIYTHGRSFRPHEVKALLDTMTIRKSREAQETFLLGAFDQHPERYNSNNRPPILFVFGRDEISDPVNLSKEIFDFVGNGGNFPRP